jgi:hypothetical protein
VEAVTAIVGEIVTKIDNAVSACHGLPVGTGNLVVILCEILNVRSHLRTIRLTPSDRNLPLACLRCLRRCLQSRWC